MDREQCLDILKDYGVGQNVLRFIEHFWDVAMLVCQASGYNGKTFKAYRGVM